MVWKRPQFEREQVRDSPHTRQPAVNTKCCDFNAGVICPNSVEILDLHNSGI